MKYFLISVFVILFQSISAQHISHLIPENTATHTAVKSGNWFETATWGGAIPGNGAIVHIPETIEVTYEGASNAHIFAIRVDGTFTCKQTNSAGITTLTFDTFVGTMKSKIQFLASGATDGKIDITIAPFDIEAQKIAATPDVVWNTEAKNHFKDNLPVYKVIRKNYGGSRYNTHTEADAGDTEIREESRTLFSDGIGVLGRHSWDGAQHSLGLVTMGEIEILGQEKTNMVKLSADALKGQRNVSLSQIPLGWEAGDDIIITRGGNKNAASNGEDQKVIASISGTSITTTQNLNKNHAGRSQDNLHCYVGNLTRNITFRSAVTDNIHHRGHFMAMHNDTNVQIKDAAFIEMGRTDKSRLLDDLVWDKWIEPTVFNSKSSALRQECSQMKDAPVGDVTNHRGRYSIHLHKAGAASGANLAQVTGNVVWGNPGWGISHHDSHANVSENVVYKVIGSGIVSETGSETGFWDNNLVVDVQKGHNESFYLAALFYDDYLFSGQGLGMKGRAVVCRGNVIANANQGVGVLNINPTINSVDRVDPLQLAAVRPGFEFDQFPLDHNGYSKEGDGVLPVEVSLIMENTTVIGASQGIRSIERDMGVNHESRSVFNGFIAWGVNQGLSITYQADYTFNDVFISGKNDSSLGVFVWKHSHNHVFNRIKMVDLAYGMLASRLVESGNGELKTRNNGFTPWYFIDLTTENVTSFYEIEKEDPSTATSYTEHPDNPIHFSASDIAPRATTFKISNTADLKVDYPGDLRFTVDGIITDDLGSYDMGIEQALAQRNLRNDYPERIYEFASSAKLDAYIGVNGVYEHPTDGYLYFIINEWLPNRLTSKYTSFPIRVKINNPPNSGTYASPKTEPAANFEPQLELISLDATVTQSSTETSVSYSGQPIDCGPQKAIDNNTNGRINAQVFQRGLVPLGSFSQTQQETEPWYDISFNELKTIEYIDLWNTVELNGASIETNSTHFDNFYILVSNTPFTNMNLTQARANATYQYHYTGGPKRKFSLNDLSITGRYMRIQAVGNTIIKLAEVEVVGKTDMCAEDTEKPMVLTTDIDIVLEASGSVTIDPSDINNNSSDNCEIATITLDKNTFTCSDLGNNTVSLTITDTNNNSETATAVVNVKSLPPTINCPTGTQLIIDNGSGYRVPDFSNLIVDDCGIGNLTITQIPTVDSEITTNTDVNLSVEDESGHTANCIINIEPDTITLSQEEIINVNKTYNFYPNPVSNILHLEGPNTDRATIRINNINGQLIHSINKDLLDHLITIDVSNLEQGLYFLQISNDNQRTVIEFIKV